MHCTSRILLLLRFCRSSSQSKFIILPRVDVSNRDQGGLLSSDSIDVGVLQVYSGSAY